MFFDDLLIVSHSLRLGFLSDETCHQIAWFSTVVTFVRELLVKSPVYRKLKNHQKEKKYGSVIITVAYSRGGLGAVARTG